MTDMQATDHFNSYWSNNRRLLHSKLLVGILLIENFPKEPALILGPPPILYPPAGWQIPCAGFLLDKGLLDLQEVHLFVLRLLKEMHEIFVNSGRVFSSNGELPRSQKWIDGTCPGNTLHATTAKPARRMSERIGALLARR